MQILKEYLDLAGCWNRYVMAENKVKDLKEKNIFFGVHLKLLGPWSW